MLLHVYLVAWLIS